MVARLAGEQVEAERPGGERVADEHTSAGQQKAGEQAEAGAAGAASGQQTQQRPRGKGSNGRASKKAHDKYAQWSDDG